MILCGDMRKSFTCILIKCFFDNFPMFSDSFSGLSTLSCPRIRCKLSVQVPCVAHVLLVTVLKSLFLGDRLQNGSPYAIGPLSVLSCLSITLVHCGQTVGRIKMKLGNSACR